MARRCRACGRAVAATCLGTALAVHSSSAAGSPALDWYTIDKKVESVSSAGTPVIPDRFDCEVVVFSQKVGRLPILRKCQNWEFFEDPRKVQEIYGGASGSEVPYVPFEFSKDGHGLIRFPKGGGGGSGEYMDFLIAWSKASRYPSVVVLANSNDPLRLIFPKRANRSPVLTRPPTCTLVARKESGVSVVGIQLSVAFSDPEGGPLQFRWVMHQGRLAERGKMEVEAQVLPGPQLFTALACDERVWI